MRHAKWRIKMDGIRHVVGKPKNTTKWQKMKIIGSGFTYQTREKSVAWTLEFKQEEGDYTLKFMVA